jgi:aerobic C4-dicarboxylate transport protein
MSEARALTNIIGNGVATVVVAKWTGDLDVARMQHRLAHATLEETDTPEKMLDEQFDAAPV